MRKVIVFCYLIALSSIVLGAPASEDQVADEDHHVIVTEVVEEGEPKQQPVNDQNVVKQIEIESNDCILTESETLDNSERYKDHTLHNANKNLIDDELPVSYDGAQLWRIDIDDQHEKNAVADLQHNFDVAMWNVNSTSVDMLFKKPIINEARRILETANVTYEVIIDNLQNAIEEENPPKEVIEQLQNRKARSVTYYHRYRPPPVYNRNRFNYRRRLRGAVLGYNSLDPPLELWRNAHWGHRMTWQAFHRLEDIHGYLDYLANTYPDLCSVQSIGYSVQKRDLKVLRISNGNANNKAIWMDGGIHAREWISPATVTFIINDFVETWDEQPEYVKNIDWYILAVSNPDGYEYTHSIDRLWRKNRGGLGVGRCAGVDLNRNFGFHWGGQGASRQPCAETFAGSGAFSEPETKALKDFMTNSAAKFYAYLTFHSYGQYILYPWGYDKTVPTDYKDLDRVGKMGAVNMQKLSGLKYQVGPSGSLLYPASGASDDWAKGVLNIKYTYTIELRDSGRHGFILPASQIEPTGREAIEFVHVVAAAVSSEP